MRALQRREPGGQRGQVGVAEPGAALCHRGERVGLWVVRGEKQRAVLSAATATPPDRADDHQIERVGELGAVVPLELDPQPAAGACLVAGRLDRKSTRLNSSNLGI